jgi:hypothetical protein
MKVFGSTFVPRKERRDNILICGWKIKKTKKGRKSNEGFMCKRKVKGDESFTFMRSFHVYERSGSL